MFVIFEDYEVRSCSEGHIRGDYDLDWREIVSHLLFLDLT